MKFRLQALVHQGEPEELDIVPHVVRPRAVIAVVIFAVVIVAVVIWSFIGNLPRNTSAAGLLSSDTALDTVQSTQAGVVAKVAVAATDHVSAGQRMVSVVDSTGTSHDVVSPFAGTAISVSASVGEPVQIGSALVTLQPGAGGIGNLHAVLFVPSTKASGLGPGMAVTMAVDSAPSAAFGQLRGKVTSVDPYPVTSGQALAILGNDLLVNRFVNGGAVQVVTITLTVDHSTKSGYAWTTKNGPPFPLLPQALLTATVHVSSEHPINVVFGR